MTRETKVGLAVAASFVCLVGGVFATKYLHGPKPDAVAQAPAPDKQPAGEESQHAPPTAPLYTPPESKGALPPLDLSPVADPPARKPATPPPDLDLLGPPGGPPPSKPSKGPPPIDDPMKDDVFNPTPVPTKPAKPSGPPPDLDLAPVPAPKKLPPDALAPPPSGGVTRVANPPDPIPGLELDLPGEKKDGKPAEKKLPPPAGVPDLTLTPPAGNNPPNLPAPSSDGKPPIAAPPTPNKPAGKKMDPPPGLPNPKPSDVPPPVSKDLPKMTIPGDPPAPLPKQPAKPVDPGSSMLPKDNNAGAASLGPKAAPMPENTTPPPEAPVTSYDEEWYYCKQGDTLESISQKFFFSPKYEQALRQYNLDRNHQASFRQERPSLSVGQVVKVPPARILERLYPATLPGYRPTANTKPDAAGGPTTIPPTATPGTEDLGQAREYVVRRDGMTLKDIAREELRDERQWTRIFMLNREWNPSAAIPKDTHIHLPRTQ